MRSSRAAVDLIVRHEVSSRALYEKKYQRPEWPGVQSGITVGIGYDLGYNTREDILNDWKDVLPPDVVREMQRYAGITKQAAKNLLSQARQNIIVPWEPAMAVFMKTSLPKFEKMVLRACPGSEKLPAGCFGMLASLTYNRGASFSKEGDRYREMRNIRAHVVTGRWDLVPGEFRVMKRIWPNVPGLQRRREEEAQMWEASLRAAAVEPVDDVSARIDTGDDRDATDYEPAPVTPMGNEPDTTDEKPINIQPSRARYSLETELIQRALISMGYYEVGDPDGKAGGKFVAGVAAFMTDRGKDPNKGRITQELKDEIENAKSEVLANGQPWSRPIAPARANATAKDIAPKVASVKTVWYQKLIAWVLGIPSAIGAGLKGIFGDQGGPLGYIQPVKDFFSSVPAELYMLAGVGLAVAIFLVAKKTQDETVKDYQQGKIN
jgi:hypothetical protein